MKFVITDKCIKCGACCTDCPNNSIKLDGVAYKITEKCIQCGDCYNLCPVGAVRLIRDEENSYDI